MGKVCREKLFSANTVGEEGSMSFIVSLNFNGSERSSGVAPVLKVSACRGLSLRHNGNVGEESDIGQ
eukprot:IDg9159t1